MLTIRKITHRKKSFNRKLQPPFEVESLCKLMIVTDFASGETSLAKKKNGSSTFFVIAKSKRL